MDDTTDTPVEMTGTPITRSGGYLIRIGWRAVGYSVDRDTESRYRTARAILFMLALVVGVGTAMAVEYVFFTLISPKAVEYLPWIRNSPELWRLVIYGLTLVCGGFIYLLVLASVGKGMVKGRQPFDEGYSLLEQRRRGSFKKKRILIPLFLLLVGIFFAPQPVELSHKLMVALVFGTLFVEGVYFSLTTPKKMAPDIKRRF